MREDKSQLDSRVTPAPGEMDEQFQTRERMNATEKGVGETAPTGG